MLTKTIIFDLGGVLLNLDWDKVCTPLAELSARGAGYVRGEVINGPVVQSCMRGLLNPREFHEALCGKLEAVIAYEDFVDIWTGLLSANNGIVPLVERLEATNRLVLASNTDEVHFSYALRHFPVLKPFDRYFLSYEMRLLKPEPEFFHEVLRGLDTLPSDCVFIDDRAENVESARRLGIPSLLFEGNEELQTQLGPLL